MWTLWWVQKNETLKREKAEGKKEREKEKEERKKKKDNRKEETNKNT